MKLTVRVKSGSGRKIAQKLTPLVKAANKVALPKIAAMVAERAVDAAAAGGPTAAKEYERALSQPGAIKLSKDELTVKLGDGPAKAFEEGMESWDIKTKMLAKTKKFAKDGSPYADVPFKHAITRGSVSVPTMPDDVRNAMRSAVNRAQAALVAAGASEAQAKTATVRLKRRTPGAQFQRELSIGGKKVMTRVQHARGLHDDMIRTAKLVKGNKVRSQYTTIRRISKNSDQWAWWHPGFAGRRIMGGVLSGVRREIASIVRESYKSVGLRAKVVVK